MTVEDEGKLFHRRYFFPLPLIQSCSWKPLKQHIFDMVIDIYVYIKRQLIKGMHKNEIGIIEK